MKQIFLILLLLVTISIWSQSNTSTKCYDLCKVFEKSADIFQNKFIYTGTDFSNPYVQKKIISVTKELSSPAETKWIKKPGSNCLSRDPNDCLVWCLVDVPATYKIIPETIEYLVTDTFQVKEFEVTKFKVKSKLKTKNIDIEVICKEKITKELIKKIEKKLIEDGYSLRLSKLSMLTDSTAVALESYQEEYHLPIGGLNIPTLVNMGIYTESLK